MYEHSRDPPPYFLTLRVWPEETGADEPVWRGRIQNTANGEVRYFQGWEALVDALLRLMEEDSVGIRE